MTKSYFRRIIALVSFILSGVSILSKATGYFNGGPYFSHAYSAEYRKQLFPNSYNQRKRYDTTCKIFSKQVFRNKSYEWIVLPPRGKKEGESLLHIVNYQSENSILFDAKKNVLSLHGASVLTYDKMKLEAHIVALHLNANTISAKGMKDLHNRSIGNPIFTYEDVTKNKYGKDGSTNQRTFFMEKFWYNIDTKRALAYNLLTKQEASIINSKQVKKEDAETFYAEDLVYTTCGLAHPHFYIRTKRAKMVQDKQITTGPFRFYFDNVPTPLGCMFGTLFLEGKRTHGIIPPDIGEEENGFYLRNGGYYINFNDYADISILGSIYSSGIVESKNELRYKKRYLCSGNVFYAKNIMEQDQGWAFKWEHKTLTHGAKSFNAHIDLHNKSYKPLGQEDTTISQKMAQESSASLSYDDQLIGFPYGLSVRAAFKKNFLANFTHWTLPTATLNSTAWYPFRMFRPEGTNHWFHNIKVNHTINFEKHFQNAKKEPTSSWDQNKSVKVPSIFRWNHHMETGMKHTIPLSMQCKAFEYVNLKPHFTYNEGWYWLEKGTKGPIRVPGFNRMYSWHFGSELGTTLYHTHYFKEANFVQGFRIEMEPSVDFTYTPDFSKKYFREEENEKGEKKQAYAFAGLRPSVDLANRATSILSCTLHNKVSLKVKNAIDPEKKDKEATKQTSRKIFLFKNLDFSTKYDFKAKKCHLTDGIHMHIASEAKVGEIGEIGFDLTTNFDPYLSETVRSDNGKIKEEPINAFAWHHGQYLGKVKAAKFKVSIDCTDHSIKAKNKSKSLLNDDDERDDDFTSNIKANKIDFETPWRFSCEFNWTYTKLYEYPENGKKFNTEKYVTFNGSITLIKKWQVSLRSTYNFTERKFNPSNTEIAIQRDLHCWQLSYQWHPLGDVAKYDFSLGVKANVLKALKLPRKRSYNTKVIRSF